MTTVVTGAAVASYLSAARSEYRSAQKMATKILDRAKRNKSDEFYTQMSDIESEMRHYHEQLLFKDKVIFCNCDDPLESNFFKYFALNFKSLGLKKLTAVGYNCSAA